MTFQTYQCDIIILGGGIAGLWTLNRLRQQGVNAILLEPYQLGGGQTIKSQGIIHGGIKYALKGRLTGCAKAIAEMPGRWRDCLAGTGEIDLSRVDIQSPHYYLWSTTTLSSRINNFLASKVLNSHNQALKPHQYPPLFQHDAFKGKIYQVEEIVLNIPSLINALAAPFTDFIFKVNPDYELVIGPDNAVQEIRVRHLQHELCLRANHYIFTAGEGNADLLAKWQRPTDIQQWMQRRPLQMVWVKLAMPATLFAHCIGHQTTPRLTITSHPAADNKTVWYLGGQLAEEGVERSPEQQIAAAKQEVKALFPWLDLQGSIWGSLYINRAEERQANGKRPESVGIKSIANCLFAWPTKLTLTPYLVDKLLEYLPVSGPAANTAVPAWERPAVSPYPWDEPS